jgi:hypothetical protein
VGDRYEPSRLSQFSLPPYETGVLWLPLFAAPPPGFSRNGGKGERWINDGQPPSRHLGNAFYTASKAATDDDEGQVEATCVAVVEAKSKIVTFHLEPPSA